MSATPSVTSIPPPISRPAADKAGLEVRCHVTFEVHGLRQAWDDLSASGPAGSVFTTYEWCRCWAETVGSAARPAIFQVTEATGRTVGIAPLCVEQSGPVRWLQFMGRRRVSGDHLDVLCRPGYEDACVHRLLDHLDGDMPAADGLILGELESASRTLAAFTAWAGAHRYPTCQREQRSVPFITLPATFDAYLASLSANMRYHVRRRRRSLAKSHSLRVTLARDAREADDLLTDFFALHRRRWERDGLTGNFQDEIMQRWLRRFCRVAADRGWLRCYALRDGRQTHCVMIAFHWRDTACYYQMGWDPDSPVASPGVVVMAASIEQAIREGLRCYDFLRGDEAYKRRWASQAAGQTTLVIGCRIPARAVMTAERAKDAAKVVFRRCFGQRGWEGVRRRLTGVCT